MMLTTVFVVAILFVLIRYYNLISYVKEFLRFYILLNKFPYVPKTPLLGNLRELICDDGEFFSNIGNNNYTVFVCSKYIFNIKNFPKKKNYYSV